MTERYLTAKKSGWSESYSGDVERSLKVYFKKLHSKALTEINRTHVYDELAVIQKERGDTTRNRARSHLSAFFNWASVKAFASATRSKRRKGSGSQSRACTERR